MATDPSNEPYSLASPLTVGVQGEIGRAIAIVVPNGGEGNVTLNLTTGSITIPVYEGVSILPFEVALVASATATATYYSLD